MKIDISMWREFRIGDLFSLKIGKANNTILEDGSEALYIGAKKKANGVMRRCKRDLSIAMRGNCILFICNGQGSVGFTNYIDKDFIATTDIVAGYNPHLNPYVGLFLVTVFDLERPKYSYGRKWKTHLADTKVLLPALESSGEPDWQYMEDYIKNLPCYSEIMCRLSCGYDLSGIRESVEARELDAKSNSRISPFSIGELFDVELTKGDLKEDSCVETKDRVGDELPLISAGDTENGFIGYVDKYGDGKASPFPSNIITVDMFCKAYYQPKPFYAVGHGRINMLLPKFEMNVYRAMYICAVINNERYRFSYGRAVYSGVLKDLQISLPVDANGNPDWQYMEDYIKSLPAGDKLANL